MTVTRRRLERSTRQQTTVADPDLARPATRQELMPLALLAIVLGVLSLAICNAHGYLLLYGDAVAHLGIARSIVDTNTPGLGQLGDVWLPLPHVLMLPFIGNMQWWQDGMAGTWPSLVCYVFGVMGMYRLGRLLMAPRWALVATLFFALNANLLYLATTAMTEPLFLALTVWICALTLEMVAAFRAGDAGVLRNRMVVLGVLILAAVMTRYDGWILGAVVWATAAWHLWKKPELRTQVRSAFVTMTVLAVVGPLSWFVYNHFYGHDWLDFMRGPYSAKEIDRKTSPPGAHKYWGWHNPAWSLMLYARTAQVDAAWWETGWLLAAAALWGTWRALRDKATRVWLLLWLPLPFYVYSISYGSVPIFIPQLYPHAFYNSRYGMELLPALAIFGAYAAWRLGQRFLTRFPLAVQLLQPVALVLVVLNTILMMHATPLVLKEGMVNSRGRLALDDPLAQQLASFPAGSIILMENSNHVGALQKAGVPLRKTIGPSDYYGWQSGLKDPAGTANYVIAMAGDELSHAIAEHPQGLTELAIICASKQPCARIYQSDRFAGLVRR